MKLRGRFTAVALAAMLALSAAGCSSADTSWVYEQGERRMPAGVYLHYMLDAYTEAETKYMDEKTAQGEEITQAVKSSELLKFQIEDKTAKEWIPEKAQKFALQYYGAEDKFASKGMALSPEDAQQVASTANGMWEYSKKFYEANGIGEESVLEYFTVQKKKEVLFLALYGKEGETPVSDQALKDAFANEYVKAEYMRITKQTVAEEGQDLEALNAEIKTKAEGYLARLKSGEEVEELVYEYRQSTAAQGEEITKPEKGSYSLILSKKDAPNYGALGEGFLSVTAGEPALYEDDQGYYLIRKQDILENAADLDNYRESLLGALKYEEYLTQLEEWGAAKSPVANTAALSRYTADKLDMDYQKYFS